MIHRVACSLLTLAVVGGLSHADEPKQATTQPPQWRRILKGDDAAKAESLEQRIAQLRDDDRSEAIKQAEALLELRGRLQGEDHWQVELVSLELAGLPKVDQHKKVMAVFSDELRTGEVHALSIKVLRPSI